MKKFPRSRSKELIGLSLVAALALGSAACSASEQKTPKQPTVRAVAPKPEATEQVGQGVQQFEPQVRKVARLVARFSEEKSGKPANLNRGVQLRLAAENGGKVVVRAWSTNKEGSQTASYVDVWQTPHDHGTKVRVGIMGGETPGYVCTSESNNSIDYYAKTDVSQGTFIMNGEESPEGMSSVINRTEHAIDAVQQMLAETYEDPQHIAEYILNYNVGDC